MRTGKTILALAAVSLSAATAVCQSRVGHSISGVGSFRSVGQGKAGYFQRYSYGLGSMQSRAGLSSNILRSGISGGGGFSLNRGGATKSGGGLGMALPLPAAGRTAGAPKAGPAVTGGFSGGTHLDRLLDPRRQLLVGQGGSYLGAISGLEDEFRQSGQPLTSLVPSEPSPFAKRMQDGDISFREGSYSNAMTQFRLAYDMGSDWMSSLCMYNCQFATSSGSYYAAGHYLRQTIRHMPELATLNLNLKGFFGDTGRYAKRLLDLETHVKMMPKDVDAALLLSVHRWFGDDKSQASLSGVLEAMEQAYRAAQAANDAANLEALETLWSGMTATGLVSGTLRDPKIAVDPVIVPAEQPASATGPSSSAG